MTALCDKIRQAARQSEILEVFDGVEGSITAEEIAARSEMSINTVRKELRRLHSSGLVNRRGPQPYDWTVSESAPSEISPEAVISHG